jgi:hypothetical protein
VLIVLGLAAAPAVTPARAGAPAKAPAPPGLREFMGGLAQVESGGRYRARNPVSGAYGKYQIMPFNWPAWSKRYLGRRAAPTPENQERVAAGRLSDLYRAYGSWDRTAYWWLTGKKGPPETWSASATRYVNNVLFGYRLRRNSPVPGGVLRIDDAADSVRYAGAWKTAHHRAYVGGQVHFATAPGAAVGLRFVGRSIRIEGPTGPTRGRAAVYVDGRRTGTVDLRASRFQPRRGLLTIRWAERGEHWVELRVLSRHGTRVVAIDRIVIRG